MKTRPWHYLVEFHHHDNTECTQPRPKPGRGLMKLWGSGDLPLCAECEKLDRAQNSQLQQLGRVVDQENENLPAAVPASTVLERERDPD